MSDDAPQRFGFVAIVGRTNVGKSTLINRLVGEKLAIVSSVAQTTRHRILGVRTLPHAQIAFLDSPGFHKPQHQLGYVLMETARGVAGEADVVLFVVDAAAGIGPGDRHVLGELRESGRSAPIVAVLNKVDQMNKGKLLPMIDQAVNEWGCKEAVPVSALHDENCDRLVEAIVGWLPEGPAHYPPDFVTDQAERRMIAEVVREKALDALRQEVPHALAVRVEAIAEREDGLIEIGATLFVEREGQKGIVIGAGGSRLKEVGTRARKELESRLGRKVFLELWVRVRPGWRDKVGLLRDFDVYPG
jgi:GTP-binding protein Era